MRTLLLACLLVAAIALPSRAGDPPMTKLRVEVRTYTDKPVERASVVIKFLEGFNVVKMKKRQTAWEIRTNQEGVAILPSIPQGKIGIQVIAKGYQTYGQTIEVNEEEKTVEVKLNAPQPQYSAH